MEYSLSSFTVVLNDFFPPKKKKKNASLHKHFFRSSPANVCVEVDKYLRPVQSVKIQTVDINID